MLYTWIVQVSKITMDSISNVGKKAALTATTLVACRL